MLGFLKMLIPVLESAKTSGVVFWIQVDASGPNFPGEKDHHHVLKIIKTTQKTPPMDLPPQKKTSQNTW